MAKFEKVSYEIYKCNHDDEYVLMKYVVDFQKTKGILSSFPIFFGTIKECRKELKKIKGRKEEISNGKRNNSIKNKKSNVRK